LIRDAIANLDRQDLIGTISSPPLVLTSTSNARVLHNLSLRMRWSPCNRRIALCGFASFPWSCRKVQGNVVLMVHRHANSIPRLVIITPYGTAECHAAWKFIMMRLQRQDMVIRNHASCAQCGNGFDFGRYLIHQHLQDPNVLMHASKLYCILSSRNTSSNGVPRPAKRLGHVISSLYHEYLTLCAALGFKHSFHEDCTLTELVGTGLWTDMTNNSTAHISKRMHHGNGSSTLHYKTLMRSIMSRQVESEWSRSRSARPSELAQQGQHRRGRRKRSSGTDDSASATVDNSDEAIDSHGGESESDGDYGDERSRFQRLNITSKEVDNVLREGLLFWVGLAQLVGLQVVEEMPMTVVMVRLLQSHVSKTYVSQHGTIVVGNAHLHGTMTPQSFGLDSIESLARLLSVNPTNSAGHRRMAQSEEYRLSSRL